MAWIAVVSNTAYAQIDYPLPRDPYINDFANLLTTEDAAAIRDMLAGMKASKGIEATVVTIQSMQDYATGDSNFEQFATGLFNAWGIGNRARNDGVLILVAARDRKVRIEVGDGYGRTLDGRMKSIINRRMLPHFKNNHYSQGILAGARSVSEVLARLAAAPVVTPRAVNPAKPEATPLPAELPPGAALPVAPRSVPAPRPVVHHPPHHNPPRPPIPFHLSSRHHSITQAIHPRSTFHTIPAIVFLAGGAAMLLVLVVGASFFMRRRPRRCSHCNDEMNRLDEIADDMFLDSGQQLEERLGSVDYDIWQCPRCNTRTIETYRAWFTRYKGCPQCGRRALESSSETLLAPTYSSSGQQRLSRDCRNCSHHDERMVILPMLVEHHHHHHGGFGSSGSSGSSFGAGGSHSSGGGSFGGGHSSGGGASGSW